MQETGVPSWLMEKQLNGHEFEQSLGDNEGQGSLECYSSWGHRVGRDLATEQQWKSRGILGAVETFLPGGRLCKRRVCL